MTEKKLNRQEFLKLIEERDARWLNTHFEISCPWCRSTLVTKTGEVWYRRFKYYGKNKIGSSYQKYAGKETVGPYAHFVKCDNCDKILIRAGHWLGYAGVPWGQGEWLGPDLPDGLNY